MKTTEELEKELEDLIKEKNEMSNFNEEMLIEALALIKALAPKEAPSDLFCIKGATGLNIMKNDMLPENTIMVSKRLFDLIYETARPYNDQLTGRGPK